MHVPSGYPEVVAMYGDPSPRVLSTGELVVSPAWERANMVLVRNLPGVAKLYCHRLIVEPLRRALTTATATGWAPKTIGCFSPRAKRSSAHLSLHTFGVAVDIDAADNAMILHCAPDDERRKVYAMPDAVIAAFAAEGFMWGGAFSASFDPMHFQLATGC